MRWQRTWVCVLSLVGLVGCLRTFGPGGALDRAMKKDQKEWMGPSSTKPSKPSPQSTTECPSESELDALCEDPDDEICPRECLE